MILCLEGNRPFVTPPRIYVKKKKKGILITIVKITLNFDKPYGAK